MSTKEFTLSIEEIPINIAIYKPIKDEKNGIGLGLYMSKTIIQEHHNAILSVENINGGACFKIEFKNSLV